MPVLLPLSIAAPLRTAFDAMRYQRPGGPMLRARSAIRPSRGWPRVNLARRTGPPQRRRYFDSGGGLLFVELNGTAGPLGFFDCLGFFFSLLLRS
jgi:hypothetical protein